MKIICVCQNYLKHRAEMGAAAPIEHVIFMKPDTAVLLRNRPFYIPDFSQNVQYEAELVIKISKNGKYIQEQFAASYYEEIALGIDFTARDLQTDFKKRGLPWTLCKGFDNSAPLSEFIPINSLADKKKINFSLQQNGKLKQVGCSDDMIFSFERLITYISKFITLKMGDIIFTGTPAGVGTVKIGDRITGFIENKQLLNFLIK
ncbi:MAG: fumarylacetoacetate hydrolase family protein [Bacteroidales bacterium]|nr:fumarylacetoacetate hydrolase family protein [Bacteroidales bacterium]